MGLLCHLSSYQAHLKAVCASTSHLVLETAVCDSDDSEKCISVEESKGNYDLAYNGVGCRPSPAAIEKVLTDCGMNFKRIRDPRYNSGEYTYDWTPQNDGSTSLNKRALWIAIQNSSPIQFKKLDPPVLSVLDLAQHPSIGYVTAIKNSVPVKTTASPRAPISTRLPEMENGAQQHVVIVNKIALPVTDNTPIEKQKILLLSTGDQSEKYKIDHSSDYVMVFDFQSMLQDCNDNTKVQNEFLYIARQFNPNLICVPQNSSFFDNNILLQAQKAANNASFTYWDNVPIISPTVSPLKTFNTTICAGIGDNIVFRLILDSVKHNYQNIKISYNKDVLREFRNNESSYIQFLNQIGGLLFNDSPYQLVDTQYSPNSCGEINLFKTLVDQKVVPQKPNIDHLLCRGKLLDINEPYIILTTKIRGISKKSLDRLLPQFWKEMLVLSDKYKIVIMGEKIVEENKEYKGNADIIYSIYNQIIANLPANKIIDLTVPALGIQAPVVSKIQQDCLIMKHAKSIITFGIGGNLWLAAAVANVVGYREDRDRCTDFLAVPSFKTMLLTKNWQEFLQRIKRL